MRYLFGIAWVLGVLLCRAPCLLAANPGPDLNHPVVVDASIYQVDGSNMITVIDNPFDDDEVVGYWMGVRIGDDLPVQYFEIVSNRHHDQWNISVFTLGVDIEGGGHPWWYYTECQHFSIFAPLPVVEPPVLGGLKRGLDGAFHCTVATEATESCIVQYSTDLVAWHNLCTTTPGAGVLQFTDPGAAAAPSRLYRLLAP